MSPQLTHFAVAEAEQTQESNPEQWFGKLKNGHYFYLRVRWGTVSLGCGPTKIDALQCKKRTTTIGNTDVMAFDNHMTRDSVFARLFSEFEYNPTDFMGDRPRELCFLVSITVKTDGIIPTPNEVATFAHAGLAQAVSESNLGWAPETVTPA